MSQHRVILDTDIGGDIDDAFALALLLRSPEVALNEVTTVNGNVLARRWTAEAMAFAAGHPFLPVYDGCAGSLSHPGAIEHPLTYGGQQKRKSQTEPSPDMAVRALTQYAPDVLLAIGPLTNVAVALACRPNAFYRSRFVAMCGEFQQPGVIEFNVRSDPLAANIVFASGRPVDVIPLSVGIATKLDENEVKRLEASDDRLIKLLVEWLHEFWRNDKYGKSNMYDPMTVVALLRPDLFDWRRGHVRIEMRDPDRFGLTQFVPDDAGPHRVAFGVRADEAKTFMLDRLLGSVPGKA